MITYFIHVILLIISFLPKYKNISIFNSFLNDNSYTPLNKELRSIEESIVLQINSIVKGALLLIRMNPENLKTICQNFLSESTMKSLLEDYYVSEDDFKFIYNITKDCLNTSHCLDGLIKIIKDNITILDYVEPLINAGSDNQTVFREKFENIIKIFHDIIINHAEFFNYLYNLTNKYPDLFYLMRFVKKDTQINIEPIINFIQNNTKLIFELLKNLCENYGTAKSVEFLSDFIKEHVDKTLYLINLNITEIFKFFAPFIRGDSEDIIPEVIAYIFENKKIMSELINIFIKNQTLLIEFADLIGKAKDKELILMQLPKFISQRQDFILITKDIIRGYMRAKSQVLTPVDFLGGLLRQILNVYVTKNKGNILRELTEECVEFLNYTCLGYVKDKKYQKQLGKEKIDTNMSYYYIYKFLLDTTKEKNDILTYENCLYNPPFERISRSSLDYMDNSPTFIIALIDLTKNNKVKKNFTYFDKYNFVFGSCFPQGKNTIKNTFNLTNGTKGYYHCTINDYRYMMEKLLEAFIDIENIELDPIEINSFENPEFSWANLIPFFILAIPLFILLFLFSYKQLSKTETKKIITFYKNEEKINREEEKDYTVLDSNDVVPKIKKIRFFPKWYLILNDFFNIRENINELFNFDSNKGNNINMSNRGLLYIKGIIGISTLLTILGQLFMVFLNIPMKEFGLYQFHELITDIAYVFIFIGVRYSPRIIFSCSGFTLTYKYLSFIDEDSSYCLIKFFFRQSYKYIILFIYVLFLRYSVYDIIGLFGINPMWKIFNRKELKKPKEADELLLNLFNLGGILDLVRCFSSEYNFDNSHDLFDYLWMPFNEIFFFVFGIGLISIGYKAKVRIDYFIFFLIIILLSFKIILFYVLSSGDKGIYTTLYYYIFDYGRLLLNPIFNLNYFLIGMYFGLLNYSLQKGIALDIEDAIFNYDNYGETKNLPLFSLDINDYQNLSLNRKNTAIKLASKEMVEIYNGKDNTDFFNGVKRYSINLKGINETNKKTKKPKKSYNSKELELMPFLKSTIKIIEWLREKKEDIKTEIEKGKNDESNGKNKKEKKMKIGLFFTIILLILLSIIIFFSFLNMLIIAYFDYKIDHKTLNDNYNINDQRNEKILLENFISDPFINCIFLFDMEIFVFCMQCIFFILYMKGQYSFINFFNNNYWSFFTKSYFSFLLVCNPVILLIFYQSETVVKLNKFNIFLYYCINLVFILIITLVMYITLELPLKKIFKCIVKRELPINNIEGDDDDDDDEESEEDDEEEKERIKKN